MFQKVDQIPEKAGKWKEKAIWFKDTPEHRHIVHHRDVLEGIKSLWGDPNLSKHLVYAPKRIFSHKGSRNRIYNEMWTGRWWHAVQVRLFLLIVLSNPDLLPESEAQRLNDCSCDHSY